MIVPSDPAPDMAIFIVSYPPSIYWIYTKILLHPVCTIGYNQKEGNGEWTLIDRVVTLPYMFVPNYMAGLNVNNH
jgi:hypothetical protein